ncbi:MAG: BamA/TamA family outer membrane protein [Acidobacteriota bacterium]
MTSALAALLVGFRLLTLQDVGAAIPGPVAEVIAEIRVHGNQLISDADLQAVSGLHVGDAVTSTTVTDATARLRASRRFKDVDVLKRFASIADPSKIVVVVIVDEGPMRVEAAGSPGAPIRVVKRRGMTNVLVAPIFDGDDGYGLSYGIRLAYVDVAGRRSRVSFPLTLGGAKRVGAEFERGFARGPLTRIEIGSALEWRHNPAFDQDDRRSRLWARAERAMGVVRLGGGVAWQRVRFADARDDLKSVFVDAVFDTRANPALPRNAVYLKASVERVAFRSGRPASDRARIDARGYLGLMGQTILVARVRREAANQPLPPYLASLLGGSSNLRGFKTGAFAGDVLVAASLELRLPLSPVVTAARTGISVFIDRGAVAPFGAASPFGSSAWGSGSLGTSTGGAVWMTAASIRAGLSVAHGVGTGTRVSLGAGLTF